MCTVERVGYMYLLRLYKLIQFEKAFIQKYYDHNFEEHPWMREGWCGHIEIDTSTSHISSFTVTKEQELYCTFSWVLFNTRNINTLVNVYSSNSMRPTACTASPSLPACVPSSMCTRVSVHVPLCVCVRAHYKKPLVHVQQRLWGVGEKRWLEGCGKRDRGGEWLTHRVKQQREERERQGGEQ